MSIREEWDGSNNYCLKLMNIVKDSEGDIDGLPVLSLENIQKVEAMIRTDSTYSDSHRVGRENTSAFFFDKLNQLLKNKDEKLTLKNIDSEQTLYNLIKALDRENSTHLSTNTTKDNDDCQKGPWLITNAILNFTKEEFINNLKEPQLSLKKDGLFRIIESEETGGRKNTSFASKFCHYACFHLFKSNENTEYRDNYSIYDGVLKKALPLYMKKYNKVFNFKNKDTAIKYSTIESYFKKEDFDYIEYQIIIDQIIEMSDDNISRNGFDHLLWYYFKGKKLDIIKKIYDNI